MNKITFIKTLNFLITCLFFISCGEQNNKPDPARQLSEAIRTQDVEAVKTLLATGTSPNGRPGILAPILSLRENNPEILKLLIDAGVDPNPEAAIHMQWPPIYMCARLKTSECLEMIIEAGADINSKDHYGSTALHGAVKKKRLENVKILLKRGADINAVDNEGETVLHKIADFDRIEYFKLFIENKIDVKIKNKKGQTALDILKKSKFSERTTEYAKEMKLI
jgi:ankyrin repeat protein